MSFKVLEYRRLPAILALITAFIVGVHVATLVLAYGFGHDYLMGIRDLFDLDGERNIPAVFSTGLLLICSALLWKISFNQKRGMKPRTIFWIGLAILFIYLAADEGLEIHERLSKLIAGAHTSALMSEYSWEEPYAIFVGVVGLLYLRFLFQLPRRIALWFILAGTIYVTGALGFEYLGQRYVERFHSEMTAGYDTLSAIEETLEMVGAIVFIAVLQSYRVLQQRRSVTETSPERVVVQSTAL